MSSPYRLRSQERVAREEQRKTEEAQIRDNLYGTGHIPIHYSNRFRSIPTPDEMRAMEEQLRRQHFNRKSPRKSQRKPKRNLRKKSKGKPTRKSPKKSQRKPKRNLRKKSKGKPNRKSPKKSKGK
jgi:hypothetical protein